MQNKFRRMRIRANELAREKGNGFVEEQKIGRPKQNLTLSLFESVTYYRNHSKQQLKRLYIKHQLSIRISH